MTKTPHLRMILCGNAGRPQQWIQLAPYRRRDDISPRLTWEDMHIQVFVAQRLSSAKAGAQNIDWAARVEQYRRLVRLSNCTDAAVMLLAVSVDRG